MELFDRRNAPGRSDTWAVYELVDPSFPQIVRYVGITNDPRRRFSHHVACRDAHTRKSRWIMSIKREGREPRMRILHRNMTIDEAKYLEMALITKRRVSGHPLTNLTDGGDGTAGHVLSQETRDKIAASKKGKPLSPQARARMREVMTGRPSPNLGKRLSPEWRRNISRAGRARMQDPAEREKISASGLTRYADEQERRRTADAAHKAGPQKNSKTGLKGVSFCARTKKWVAQISDGKRRMIGRFSTPEEAARAYDLAARAAWGFDCYLNFPDEVFP